MNVEELVGRPAEEVPKRDPTAEDCMGKRTDGGTFVGYCRSTPGRGTDHVGAGRCKFHGGLNSGANGQGGTEGNGNAAKHNLHADRTKLYQRLDDDQQARVDELEGALIERYETFHGREPDRADVRDLFEIAMGYVQRDLARAWMADNAAEMTTSDNPMVEEMVVGERDDGSKIRVQVPVRMHESLQESRREDRLMKKHMGLFRDPETKQAEETGRLADAMMENLTDAYESDGHGSAPPE